MPVIAVLAARPSYRRHFSNVNPNVPSELTSVTAAQATVEIREHVARDRRNRSVRATEYGAVTLHQGEHRIRFEPVPDAMPKLLSAAAAGQLLDVAQATDSASFVDEAAGITLCTRWVRIPPAATNRLVRHGWICKIGDVVSVSLPGVFALAWRDCRTSGVPAGQFADLISESLVDAFTPDD